MGGPHKNCRVTRAHSFLLPSFYSPRCFPLLLSFFSSQIYNLLARADATMECGAGALLLAACSWSGTSSLALRGGCGAARARRDGAEPSGEAARGGLPAVSSARGAAACSPGLALGGGGGDLPRRSPAAAALSPPSSVLFLFCFLIFRCKSFCYKFFSIWDANFFL